MVADEIRDTFEIDEKTGALRGQEALAFLTAREEFLENPSTETAIPLLEVAPSFRSYFEGCKPGGPFYEAGRLLHTGEEAQSPVPPGTEPTYDELLDRLVGLSREEPNPPAEVAQFLSRHGWKQGEPPSHQALHAKRWCDPFATQRWFVWQSAFGIQRERNRRGISSSPATREPLLRSGMPPRIANRLQKMSESSSLTEAFRESARPDAPPPTRWWVLPVLGIIVGALLLGVSIFAGAICLCVMSALLGAGMIRTRRNREGGR
jgi:hypothetical protein